MEKKLRLPIEIASDSVIGSIDEIKQIGRERRTPGVSIGGHVLIRGWMLDAQTRLPIGDLRIGLDVSSQREAIGEIARPDVAASHGAGASRSGFLATVPVTVGAGSQPLLLSVRSSHGAEEIVLEAAVQVEAPVDPFAGMKADSSGWVHSIDGVFDGSERLEADPTGVFVIADAKVASIRGWVLDEASGLPASEVVARSGGRYLRVIPTEPRTDVAKNLGIQSAVNAGFAIPFVPSPVGVDEVQVFAISDRRTYSQIASIRARQASAMPSENLPADDNIRGAVDELSLRATPVDLAGSLIVSEGDEVSVTGWAVDSLGPLLTGGVELVLDGTAVVQTQTRIARPDAADQFGHGDIVTCGFEMRWVVQNTASGAHRLDVRALSSRRDAVRTLAAWSLIVEPTKHRLQ